MQVNGAVGIPSGAEFGHIHLNTLMFDTNYKLILGLRPTNESRCYLVTTSLIGWVRA